MSRTVRVALLVPSIVVGFFVGGLTFSFLFPDPGPIPFYGGLASAGIAAAIAWTWSGRFERPDSFERSPLPDVFAGAMLLGGIGFLAGFVGPLVFAPEANQGPLLGIFITGPLGAVLGAVGGGVRWWTKNRT